MPYLVLDDGVVISQNMRTVYMPLTIRGVTITEKIVLYITSTPVLTRFCYAVTAA